MSVRLDADQLWQAYASISMYELADCFLLWNGPCSFQLALYLQQKLVFCCTQCLLIVLCFFKLCLFTTVVLLTLRHIDHNFWLLANLHQNMLAKKYCSAVVKTNNFVSNNLIYNFLSVCYDTTLCGVASCDTTKVMMVSHRRNWYKNRHFLSTKKKSWVWSMHPWKF